MEITTVFQKERREFGRPTTHFAPTEPVDLGGFDSDASMRDKYMERNPTVLEIQAIPSQSEHQVRRCARLGGLPSGSGVHRGAAARAVPRPCGVHTKPRAAARGRAGSAWTGAPTCR